MDLFSFDRYQIRRKFLSFVHKDFFVHGPTGEVVLWGRKKGFRLKEDIRLFGDAAMQREVLSIQARHAIDFAATYDVWDSQSRLKIGALQRKGFRSILRDEWEILGPDERSLGTMQEDSQGMALLRRFLVNLIPQSFDIASGGTVLAQVRQHFNLIHFRLDLDFSSDAARRLDRRLGVAAAVVLSVIEGRQRD